MDNQGYEIGIRDRLAGDYERKYSERGGLYDRVEKKTIYNALNLRRDDIVLDAGCGTGRLTREMAGRCAMVYGVDFSPNSLDVLNKRLREEGIGNVRFYVRDITKPLDLGVKFDKIVSAQVIQHIPSEEKRREALSNLYNLLKPGGLCVITLYNWLRHKRQGLSKEGDFSCGIHYLRFTPGEAKGMLKGCGFKDILIRGCINLKGYRILKSGWANRLFYPYGELDVLISKLRVSQYLGDLLICRAVR